MRRNNAPRGGGTPKRTPPSRDDGRNSGNAAGELGRGRAGRADRGGAEVNRPRKTPEELKQQRMERNDIVYSRPRVADGRVYTKKGVSGTEVRLLANYFPLLKRTDWCIFHYRVDFLPDIEVTREKKKLVRDHQNVLGAYICDGNSLYVSHRLAPDPLELTSLRETDRSPVVLNIRLVAQLDPTDVMYLQFYNIIVRKCLDAMGLEEIGRHYYDPKQSILVPEHRLELWPGYITSMRNHEHEVLLGVEITHKVLRRDNCLQVMNERSRGGNRQAMKDAVIGCVVMTKYNKKTYPVDDVDFSISPTSTFDQNGRQVSFIDYFKQRYGEDVRDRGQPMLVSRPKTRDLHRGMVGPILLVPELCQMTGLTDDMRSDFRLMRALSGHLQVGPDQRIRKIHAFMNRLRKSKGINEELESWGIRFGDRLVEVKGRTAARENIRFAAGPQLASDQADWNNAFRNQEMLMNVHLDNWVVIVPSRIAKDMGQVISGMQAVGRGIRYRVSQPREMIQIPNPNIQGYSNAIHKAMEIHKNHLQMLFIVLPNATSSLYAAVKKICAVDFGIPSQCFLAKNADSNNRGRMSIFTKVVVQINAKLGGEPWTVQIPLQKVMIVGFDVYHCGKRKGASVGAMVATTNANYSRYYSTVSFHNNREEVSSSLAVDIGKCLNAFRKIYNYLPERIIMYRDGVGDGQLTYVHDTELQQLKRSIQEIYTNFGSPLPKFTFIVVSKKINTRVFKVLNGYGPRGVDDVRTVNPPPGTIVDDVVTLPERYDFFIISQIARQGTVSPTSYNVLCDTSGIPPDRIQLLTYKMCHMYFNWTGTVTVPAPCQYAHKLAYLTGVALQGNSSSEDLSHRLHFL